MYEKTSVCVHRCLNLLFSLSVSFSLVAGVVSLSSNIVVMLMFVKFRELRTATNAIIINLAFTDIGVAGIGYPMSAASDLHGSWKFGYTGCQVFFHFLKKKYNCNIYSSVIRCYVKYI